MDEYVCAEQGSGCCLGYYIREYPKRLMESQLVIFHKFVRDFEGCFTLNGNKAHLEALLKSAL